MWSCTCGRRRCQASCTRSTRRTSRTGRTASTGTGARLASGGRATTGCAWPGRTPTSRRWAKITRAATTPDRDDIYLLATYDIDAHTGDWSLGEVWGKSDRFQRLISVSADESGTARRLPRAQRARERAGCGEPGALQGGGARGRHAGRPAAPAGVEGAGSEGGTRPLDWGPSAVGMSPTADRIVVVHRTLGSVLTEVFALDEGVRYARVNAHNLTEWMTLRTRLPVHGRQRGQAALRRRLLGLRPLRHRHRPARALEVRLHRLRRSCASTWRGAARGRDMPVRAPLLLRGV